MKISLITHTPNPLELLVFTKSTRLDMTPDLLTKIAQMSPEAKAAGVNYMAKTIRSSWEFVDIIFLVEGITRATAQQMTRTRTASFAMQSQRVADVSTMAVECPFKKGTEEYTKFMHSARVAGTTYSDLLAGGALKEDARGVLPINITTNLVAKYNLRNFVDLCLARESLRASSQYSDAVKEMKRLLLEQMPWAEPFFVSQYAMAIGELEAIAKRLGIVPGEGLGWDIAKAIDLLRMAG